MQVFKADKRPIYPTEEQKVFLSNHFGATRAIYNKFLWLSTFYYEENKNNKKDKRLTYNKNCQLLTELKKIEEYSWLKEIYIGSLQDSLRDLDTAYQRFFKKESSYPQFKKKYNRHKSFCMYQHIINKIYPQIEIIGNKLYIPKLKTPLIIMSGKNINPENICYITISQVPSGRYYCSITYKADIQHLSKNDNIIGLDLGIKTLVMTSEGGGFENHKFFKKQKNKLAKAQRKLSKKKKDGKNIEKQRVKVAKIHEKIANQRKDNLHKISRQIINENQVIIMENLSVKNMVKNRKLSSAISDCGWGELKRQLEYKSQWYGRTFHQVDRWFASSKQCNKCTQKNTELTLSDREWICSNCEVVNDRDYNAAVNIREKGMLDLIYSGNKDLMNILNNGLLFAVQKPVEDIEKAFDPMKQEALETE